MRNALRFLHFSDLFRINYISLFLLLIVVSFDISSCERQKTFGISENLLTKAAKPEIISDLPERARRTRRTLSGDPTDCADIYKEGSTTSGVYHIWPPLIQSIEVYCDMTTDGGGWTVIQRRGDYDRDDEYFYKNWQEYKTGFGHIKKDFWLGNENIFALTRQRTYTVRFDMVFDPDREVYAEYDRFRIENESNGYKLNISGYRGTAGNAMEHLHGVKFTTDDRDNDSWDDGNCATYYKSGWWFYSCANGNLNGRYNFGIKGMWWYLNENWESVLQSEIKIRPMLF